jgi:hypothetical protein
VGSPVGLAAAVTGVAVADTVEDSVAVPEPGLAGVVLATVGVVAGLVSRSLWTAADASRI